MSIHFSWHIQQLQLCAIYFGNNIDITDRTVITSLNLSLPHWNAYKTYFQSYLCLLVFPCDEEEMNYIFTLVHCYALIFLSTAGHSQKTSSWKQLIKWLIANTLSLYETCRWRGCMYTFTYCVKSNYKL